MGLGFLLWLWWFEAWAVVEHVVVGFLCICLDFFGGDSGLVKGCWWVWIFDSFRFFCGGCGCGFLGLPLVVVELGLGVSATLHFMGFLMGEYERG